LDWASRGEEIPAKDFDLKVRRKEMLFGEERVFWKGPEKTHTKGWGISGYRRMSEGLQKIERGKEGNLFRARRSMRSQNRLKRKRGGGKK